MKTTLLKIALFSLVAAAWIGPIPDARAQADTSTNAPAAPVKHRKHDHSVFNGKLTAVDTNAMTLTVGERTFEVSSETKITKDGQPVTLGEGVVGEDVSGAYKKAKDGTLKATSIHYGTKGEGKKKKKKTATEGAEGQSSTNSTPN